MVDPEDLKPNPGNPYIHTEKQVRVLAAIIRAAGWRQPIIVSRETGFVVKGHCRRLAALQLKAKAVPVEHQSYPSYDDEVADMIADNHVAELAYTDQATMAGIMSQMGQAAQRLTGFFTEEVARTADTVAKTVARASAEARPKATKEEKRAKVPICPVDGKPCQRAAKKRSTSVK